MTRAEPNFAVVLASHGDRAGAEPNCALMYHAEVIRSLIRLRAVTAGVLKGDPPFEEALSEAHASGASNVLVYPLFMADGYFTASVLPDRIRQAGLEATTQLMPPLGLDPGLPDLVLADALLAAERAGLDAAASRLLIVGHGSQLGPASAGATLRAAETVAGAGRFAKVATAYLEEEPFLEGELSGQGMQTIVSGFFFGDGMHAGEDVPAAIKRTGAQAIYAGPVGRSARIPELVTAAIRAEIRARAH